VAGAEVDGDDGVDWVVLLLCAVDLNDVGGYMGAGNAVEECGE